jgi:hypothetical protein
MNTALILSAAALAATLMLCVAATRAWRGWLDYKRLELASRGGAGVEEDVGVRIELAAVRERLKKLEAIASGVEL